MFFRVVELADGRWACRQGMTEIDTHGEYEAAITHIRRVAADTAGSVEIFVHQADGTVGRIPAAAGSNTEPSSPG